MPFIPHRSSFILCLAGLAALALPAQSDLGDLNCVSCHAPSAAQEAWICLKTAPRLDGLG